MFNFDLSQDIHEYLIQCPITREVDIIRHLQQLNRLPEDVLRSDLSLFRSHFLVFNALYRLQKQGQQQQAFKLDISALSICYTPFTTRETLQDKVHSTDQTQNVQQNDPLYFFYTDLKQLNQTTSADVQQLLNQFWQTFIAPETINDEQKVAALATLELSPPVDFTTIKQQYRRLAMRHHPDRGGDKNKLVSINQAMQCLEVYYSR